MSLSNALLIYLKEFKKHSDKASEINPLIIKFTTLAVLIIPYLIRRSRNINITRSPPIVAAVYREVAVASRSSE